MTDEKSTISKDEEPVIYVSRKSLEELLEAKGSHVALQTLIHRKPLKSGNGVPLYAEPVKTAPAVVVPVLKIGIYGKAYDRPDERRAYTYDEQPHNVEAHKLGRACSEINSGGDWIDRGLTLLKALQREGFGVFELPASPAAK